MWGVAGPSLAEVRGSCQLFFSSFVSLFPLNQRAEQTSSPLCHASHFVCAKNTLCLSRGLCPACPLCPCGLCLPECTRACSWLLFPLPSPFLLGRCSVSSLQAAPLEHSLTAPISVCGFPSAFLHSREGKPLVPVTRNGRNITLK